MPNRGTGQSGAHNMRDRLANAEVRVKEGVAWLDKHWPDWLDRVDPLAIDVGSVDNSPLTMASGQPLTEVMDTKGLTMDDLEALGFACATIDVHALNYKWAEEIEGRLEAIERLWNNA